MMRISEISASELKQGKQSWGDEEFNYAQSAINWKTKPSEQLSKTDLENIFKYTMKDAPPRGEIARSLDRAVEVSSPLNRNIVSYRGLMLPAKTIEEINSKLAGKKTHRFRNVQPSSWSNSMRAAWNFVKKSGYRQQDNNDSYAVILEILIPAGAKVARLNLAFGVGNEHVLPSNTEIEIDKSRPYRHGIIYTGCVINQ